MENMRRLNRIRRNQNLVGSFHRYYFYFFKKLVLNRYSRIFYILRMRNFFKESSFLKLYNILKMYREIRKKKTNKLWAPVGLYIYVSKRTVKCRSFVRLISGINAFLWKDNKTLSFGMLKKSNKYKNKHRFASVLPRVALYLGGNFIRREYQRIFRYDRMKFPLVRYEFSEKIINLWKQTQKVYKNLALRRKFHFLLKARFPFKKWFGGKLSKIAIVNPYKNSYK